MRAVVSGWFADLLPHPSLTGYDYKDRQWAHSCEVMTAAKSAPSAAGSIVPLAGVKMLTI